MKLIYITFISFLNFNCIASFAKSAPIINCFIATKNGETLKTQGDCYLRVSPCSTFKIALALMGFDAGMLTNQDSPKWAFKKEYEKNLPDWYTPEIGEKLGWFAEHTPTTYMSKSVIWFSHLITQRLGKEKFQAYVNKLNYGNRDVSGTTGQDDGLFMSWLETSLKISPREQVEFLEKMLMGKLNLSEEAQKKTADIMLMRNRDGSPIEWNGWRLYGKTGGGTRCTRWLVGWIEKGKEKIVFAQYIGLPEDTPELRASAPKPIDVAQKNLSEFQ